jgi:polyhydroxyalkanoate synthesis regulator phasin
MIDLIKKTLLAGVGAAVVTKEKVEETLGEYVRQGKVNAADARIIAEKIAEQGRIEWEEASAKLSAKFKEFAARSDETTKARLTELEERVRVLEQKLTPPATRAGEP